MNTVKSHEIDGIEIPEYNIPDRTSDLITSLITRKNTNIYFPCQNLGGRNSKADFVSANHIWPAYSRYGSDSISEGGLAMQELGSKTIKTYVCNYYERCYRLNKWPTTPYKSPAELASCEYYKRLFSMDLNTYVLGVFIFSDEFGGQAVYFRNGFPEKARKMEYQQLYDLTYYLCKAYEGTGKTFIIQNWESDWACVPAQENRPYPSKNIISNFIDWTNTRQDAVMAAREDAGCRDVYVYNCIEVNRIKDGMDGHPCVLYDAVPYTYCDFYSYSSYDTAESEEFFPKALDTMKKIVSENRTGGQSQCFIGEFGYPTEWPSEKRDEVVKRVLNVARKKHFSHVFWWELYGNPEDPYTYWLISKDNEYSRTWNDLYKFINGTDSKTYLEQQDKK